MFHIALYEPQIAPNTGNIIRLMANNGSHLHLIEPLGFDLETKKLRRAGLDYRDMTSVTRYPDYTAFLAQMGDRRIFACTTKGNVPHDGIVYRPGDVLLFDYRCLHRGLANEGNSRREVAYAVYARDGVRDVQNFPSATTLEFD